MIIIQKISGIILLICGFIITFKPDLLSSSPIQLNAYEMIEKRVKWGFVIGLGIFLIGHHQWENWQLTLWALLFCLTLGIITARILGFLMDGFFWFLVLEMEIMLSK